MNTTKLLMLCGMSMFAFTADGFCGLEATVRLNNSDAQKPIYWWHGDILELASGPDFYVEIWGAGAGGFRSRIAAVGTGQTVFQLNQSGYFDGGVGVIPGAVAGATIDLQIRAWKGALSYEQSRFTERGLSDLWTQVSGAWDPTWGIAATGPVLMVPSNVRIGEAIPEPSTLTLGIIGGMGLVTNGVLRTLKSVSSSASKEFSSGVFSTSTNRTGTIERR